MLPVIFYCLIGILDSNHSRSDGGAHCEAICEPLASIPDQPSQAKKARMHEIKHSSLS